MNGTVYRINALGNAKFIDENSFISANQVWSLSICLILNILSNVVELLVFLSHHNSLV